MINENIKILKQVLNKFSNLAFKGYKYLIELSHLYFFNFQKLNT